MIQRIGYDLVRTGWRLAWQLWPVWFIWWAWDVADAIWAQLVPMMPTIRILWFEQDFRVVAEVAQPLMALAGPAIIMAFAIWLHRAQIGSRAMALVGIGGVAITTLLTVWPEYRRLAKLVAENHPSVLHVLNAIQLQYTYAFIGGFFITAVGWIVATGPRPLGCPPYPTLLRGTSDNFGHADWLPMDRAKKRFPGPDPAYGGLVVGEAYRVDQDRVAKRGTFDPKDRRTWGNGGTAPLLIDPCHEGATHALVFAGSNGFKTTASAIPTLLTWTGAAIVLDPSREIGPMLQEFRQRELGHQVVTLDPAKPASGGFNVLDWIDPNAPLAETHVEAVVGWISGETRLAGSATGDFFRDKARELITCLLADLIWDPEVPARQKTLRTLRARLVTPEDEMRELLETISRESHSLKARQLASTLKGAVKETYSGFYQNATRDTAWLSTAAYADLVSGTSFNTRDLTAGKLTVFVQIPLHVLDNTPALGRVIIGALLNAVYEADGGLSGRVLFLLDEVARLGFMKIITQARDAGRKYGITMLLLYQSLGQLIEQWGADGKTSWYESTSWRLYAAIQDRETAREVSELCGDFTVIATSTGDTEGVQSRSGMGASSSAGRSESRSEIRRALIKPEELIQDCRVDEAFVMVRGSPPLRCGRAIYFRRREWDGQVGTNRFHRHDRDAAE